MQKNTTLNIFKIKGKHIILKDVNCSFVHIFSLTLIKWNDTHHLKNFSHQSLARTSNESFIKHSISLRKFLSLEVSFSKRCSIAFSRLGRCRSQRQTIVDLERVIFFLSVKNKIVIRNELQGKKKIKRVQNAKMNLICESFLHGHRNS